MQVGDLHPQWTPTNAGQAHQPYSSGAVERAPGLLAGCGTGPHGAGMPEGAGVTAQGLRSACPRILVSSQGWSPRSRWELRWFGELVGALPASGHGVRLPRFV